MKAYDSVWDKVLAIVDDGGVPSVEVTEAMRTNDDGHKWFRRINSNKEGYILTSTGHRMSCANPGCSKKLKKNPKDLACSDKCREELTLFCNSVMDVMEGRASPFDFPVFLRSIRGVPRGSYRRTIRQSRLVGIDQPEWRVRDERKAKDASDASTCDSCVRDSPGKSKGSR